MNVSIMQPYFLPYIGYFQLIASCDVFVSLDDVNFINRGWINRNNLIFNNKKYLFSIPLEKASQNLIIADVKISKNYMAWRAKFLKSLKIWYGKEIFFHEGMALAEEILTMDADYISDLNYNSLVLIAGRLGLKTSFKKSSELGVPRTKGSSRLVAIMKFLNADNYVNPPGGKALYNSAMFSPDGINLHFLKPTLKQYRMPEWIPGLSVLDAIMREGIEYTANSILPGYEIEPASMESHYAQQH